MSKCEGLHCPGCGNGGFPWLPVGAGLVVLAVIAREGHAIAHAADVAVTVLVITAAGLAGLALAAAGVVIAVRVRRALRQRQAPAVILPRARVRVEAVRPAAALPAPARTVGRPRALRSAEPVSGPQARPQAGPGKSGMPIR